MGNNSWNGSGAGGGLSRSSLAEQAWLLKTQTNVSHRMTINNQLVIPVQIERIPFYPFLHLVFHFSVFAFFPAVPEVHWTESLFLCGGGCYAKSVKASLKKTNKQNPYSLFFFKITLDKTYTKHCDKNLWFK